jgi:hypothetical protein
MKEQLARELDSLNEAELKQVSEYVMFLKFKSRVKSNWVLDETQLAALYAEFAEEERQLAEEGMADYTEEMVREEEQQPAAAKVLPDYAANGELTIFTTLDGEDFHNEGGCD